jgi:hypothetical protein
VKGSGLRNIAGRLQSNGANYERLPPADKKTEMLPSCTNDNSAFRGSVVDYLPGWAQGQRRKLDL